MRVLVACERSGIVRRAFRARGYDAWSCDLVPADDGSEYHHQCDVLTILGNDWDLMIAHPECRFLSNAGVRHLHDRVTSRKGGRTKISGSERWVALFAAAEFFNTLKSAPIKKKCIENPIPHKYARALIGKYSQIIQPWQFGHPESKATCLWLEELPPLKETSNVKATMLALPRNQAHRIHYASPGPERTRIRSETFPGIANAMADQWG